MKNNITLYEHDTLYVGDNKNEITLKEFHQLERYSRLPRFDLYKVGNKSIKFRNYVGLIRVGNRSINVLPKIGQETSLNWDKLLFTMINISKSNPKKINNINFNTANNLLELFIWEFIGEVGLIIKSGLRKGYRSKEKNSSVIRGKIKFNKDVVINHSNKAKKYIQYEDYNHNIFENNILYMAIIESINLTHNPFLIDELHILKSTLEIRGVDKRSIKSLKKPANYSRNNLKYRTAIELAFLILKGRNPSEEGNEHDVISFLFDMNKLYEDYVFYSLKKHLRPFGYSVNRELKNFWENKIIKPDIVIKHQEKSFILDTKWKDISKNEISDGDLKQMFVYNLYWDCNEAILLYPTDKQFIEKKGQYHEFSSATNDTGLYCTSYQIPLFNESGEVDTRSMIQPILSYLGLAKND